MASKSNSQRTNAPRITLLLLLSLSAAGCTATVSGGNGTGGGNGGKPQVVAVNISPQSASAILGATTNFQATVTGATNTQVTWSVNGAAGGNSQSGTISASGQYTAPAILPAKVNIKITATSQASTSATASATITITSDIAIQIAPAAAGVLPGAAQLFTASVTSSGKPAPNVTWSVNQSSTGDATTGTIAATGADSATYTAPTAPPSPPAVTITATSVADPSKSASASVGIGCASANQISPASANLTLAQAQNFTASLCIPAGSAVTWDVNGVVGGSVALGTVTNTGAVTTTYSAPADLPTPASITIHAAADGVSASATVTISSNVTISVAPASGTLVVQQRASFAASVSNSPDQSVVWSVNGIVNGNAQIGTVCITNSNPCVPPVGPGTATVDFLAPSVVPSTNPALLTATSNADSSKSASAQIKIVGTGGSSTNIVISPANAFLPPSSSVPSQLRFTAAVSASNNSTFTWSVSSGAPGSGCSGTACGTIDATGLYTAPTIAPSPNSISITAANVADLSESGSASVSITAGPTIEQILPSSVMAGVASDFTLAVNGAGFVAGRGSGASAILVNGNPQTTICNSEANCTTALAAQNVANPGVITIQIQNPGQPAMLSNTVLFVIVPFTLSESIISLSTAQTESDGNDIVVFEPTTAGSGPSQLNVDFAGPITAGPTCNFDSSPITLQRPPSGTATASMCIHGNTLDSGYFYQFSGPPAPDISIAPSELAGLFPNTIELDLTISSATLPGVRSLFITTPNNDQAVATGLIEVQ